MAELKVDQRQIGQPNAPDLSGAGQAYAGFGKSVQAVSHAVGDVVDSVNKLEANAQYSETLNILNKELVNALSTENIAQGGAYDRYVATAESIIEGGLSHTPKKYQAELKQDLRNKVNKFGLSLAKADLSFQESMRKSEGQAMIATHFQALDEAINLGDKEMIDSERNLINNTVADLKRVGAFDAMDEYKITQGVNKLVARADYTSKFAAMLRENPVAADIYLRDFGEAKPSNITYEEWKDIQASMLQERSSYYKAVDAAETIGSSEFQLAFDSKQIKTPEDIDNFIAQKEAEGRYFSYNDKLKMRDMLVRSAQKELKGVLDMAAIDSAILNDPDSLYKYTPQQLNKYYQLKTSQLNDAYAEQAKMNPNFVPPSQLAVKASVASKLPIEVPAFKREFSDKLQYGTTQDFEEALTVGTQLQESSPKTFSQLSSETQAYQDYAATLSGNTTLPIQNIKTASDKAILEKSTDTKDAIEKQLKKIDGSSLKKDLYKKIYGTKYVNPALQPEYDNMSNVYNSFYRASGDMDTAAKLTTDTMRTRSGASKYIPKNDITKDPIENTQLYQDHPTLVKNQMALGALEVVKNHEFAASRGRAIGPKVEWPDGIERPDVAKLSEKSFYEKPIFERKKESRGGTLSFGTEEVEPMLKIDGKNRKIFFMNPDSNLETPGSIQREIWYEDDFGLAQPLTVYKETEYKDGVVRYDSGVPTIEFKSAQRLTPEMAAIKEQEKYQDQATEHLREEFRGKKRTEKEAQMKAAREAQAGKPKGMPGRVSPLSQIDDYQRRLAIEKEEQAYVKDNLPQATKDIKESKTRKVDELLAGKK